MIIIGVRYFLFYFFVRVCTRTVYSLSLSMHNLKCDFCYNKNYIN